MLVMQGPKGAWRQHVGREAVEVRRDGVTPTEGYTLRTRRILTRIACTTAQATLRRPSNRLRAAQTTTFKSIWYGTRRPLPQKHASHCCIQPHTSGLRFPAPCHVPSRLLHPTRANGTVALPIDAVRMHYRATPTATVYTTVPQAGPARSSPHCHTRIPPPKPAPSTSYTPR